MSIDDKSTQRFYAGERTDTVRFVINDPIYFEAEDGSQRLGAVVSIHSLEPEVKYIVEPGSDSWGDVIVAQSRITLLK